MINVNVVVVDFVVVVEVEDFEVVSVVVVLVLEVEDAVAVVVVIVVIVVVVLVGVVDGECVDKVLVPSPFSPCLISTFRILSTFSSICLLYLESVVEVTLAALTNELSVTSLPSLDSIVKFILTTSPNE